MMNLKEEEAKATFPADSCKRNEFQNAYMSQSVYIFYPKYNNEEHLKSCKG